MIIAVSILSVIFAITAIIGLMIYRAQKKLDAPYGGILVVEQNDGEPAGVYFQAIADPQTFTDGQELKLKVRVVGYSQGKQ